MITQEAQTARLVRNNKIMIAYVDSHDNRYKDSFIEMVSKNIAEFNTLDLKFLEQKACAKSSYLDALYEADRENCEYLLYVELGTVIDWCDGPMKDIVEYIQAPQIKPFIALFKDMTRETFFNEGDRITSSEALNRFKNLILSIRKIDHARLFWIN